MPKGKFAFHERVTVGDTDLFVIARAGTGTVEVLSAVGISISAVFTPRELDALRPVLKRATASLAVAA